MEQVTIIVPVYNERSHVIELLDAVVRADTAPYKKEIIVVDDGSTDGTADIVKKYAKGNPVHVITHSGNRGKTNAIQSALKISTGSIILIQDADLEYSPLDYRKLLAPFQDTHTMVVYGSRFLDRFWPRRMKLVNWIANKLFTSLVNLLYGSHLTDEGTAYKVFRSDVLKSINFSSSGFEFCPEVTTKLLKRGLQIREVPVSYEARNRKEGKKPGITDGLKILWTIVKFRLKN